MATIYQIVSNLNRTHNRHCTPSDPINLIFENVSVQDVENELLRIGWKRTRWLASNQTLPIISAMNKTKQSIQIHCGSIFKRYHMRVWDIKSCLIAGVHMDRLRFIGGHTSADFESIEKDLANIFKQNTTWTVTDDAVDLGNQFGGYNQPANNGKATVIRR